MITAGELRYRLTVQNRTAVRDAFGQAIESWTDEVTVWGSVEALTGRELTQAAQRQARVTHRVRIRAPDGFTLDPGKRLTFGGDVYEIEAVRPSKIRGIYAEVDAVLQAEGAIGTPPALSAAGGQSAFIGGWVDAA